MFEISQLKEMKLPELQDIAKKLSIPKFRSLKKLDLVYQILDHQATNPKAVAEVAKTEVKKEDKPQKAPAPKRARVQKPAVKAAQKKTAEKEPTQEALEFKDEKADAKTEDKLRTKRPRTPKKTEDNKAPVLLQLIKLLT